MVQCSAFGVLLAVKACHYILAAVGIALPAGSDTAAGRHPEDIESAFAGFGIAGNAHQAAEACLGNCSAGLGSIAGRETCRSSCPQLCIE